MKYFTLLIIFILTIHGIKAQKNSSHLLCLSPTFLASTKGSDASLYLQSSNQEVDQPEGVAFFMAYELGEALFNKFQSLSGEVGIRLNNQHLVRLVHVNLHLTEEHLSSGFAGAVDGENVKGRQFGFEAFYDLPVLFRGFYVAPSMGYYKNEYEHTILNEGIQNTSFSLGLGVSYRERDIFTIKGLYYSVSVPMRFNLSPIRETQLGNAFVADNSFDNNIWLFIGYEF